MTTQCSINPFLDDKALLHVYDPDITVKLRDNNTDWVNLGGYRIKIFNAKNMWMDRHYIIFPILYGLRISSNSLENNASVPQTNM